MFILASFFLLLQLSADIFALPKLRTDRQYGRCWGSGNQKAAQWWDDGTELTRGKYYYKCMNGIIKPQGCVVNDTLRVRIAQSYVDGRYEIQCVLSGGEHLKFKFISCVSVDGRRYKAGESWDDPEKMYWFTCEADNEYLREKIGGCISHDKTRRVKLYEEYDYGNFTYKCSLKSNGAVSMCSTGCVHNGVRFKIGEQWPDGENIFYCNRTGARTQIVFIGCHHNGESLYDGDRFRDGNTIYRCDVRPNNYQKKPIGCVYSSANGTVVERVIGCRWVQQVDGTDVEQTCVVLSNEEQTAIQTLGCIYKKSTSLFIYPNTYTIWNQPDMEPLFVACKKKANGNLYLETFGPDERDEKLSGLHYDFTHLS